MKLRKLLRNPIILIILLVLAIIIISWFDWPRKNEEVVVIQITPSPASNEQVIPNLIIGGSRDRIPSNSLQNILPTPIVFPTQIYIPDLNIIKINTTPPALFKYNFDNAVLPTLPGVPIDVPVDP